MQRESQRAIVIQDPGADNADALVIFEDSRKSLDGLSVDAGIGVEEEDIGRGPLPPPPIAALRETPVEVLGDDGDRKALDRRRGVVGRGVVDEDHADPTRLDQRLDAASEMVAAVIGDDDYINRAHVVRLRRRERNRKSGSGHGLLRIVVSGLTRQA